MKSFTLHLFVLFLLGIQQNIYSIYLVNATITPKSIPLSISSSIESKTLIPTSTLLPITSKEISTSSTTKTHIKNKIIKKSSAASSVAFKSSQQTNTLIINKEKSRTARDLPIKNVEPSENSNGNNINLNNAISCTTTLPINENENTNDCIEQNNKKQQQLQEELKKQNQQLLKQEEQLKALQQASLQQASQSLWHEIQQSNRVRRTSKTPRTIQRLIAGHLTLSNVHASSTTKIEPLSNTTKIEPVSTTTKILPILESQSYTHRNNVSSSTITPPIKKPFRNRTYSNILRRIVPISIITSTSKPSIKNDDENEYRKDDDEAFLEDTKEADNWDNGILRLSAGDGKEDQTKSKKKLDPNKTLSEQVKDGKYGLIEQELFKKRPKRPGILSYLENKEFPHDNEKTLGGLNEEDIWLAEDHLLVIKGGGLNDRDRNEPWAPIDDYIERDRPIKIPENPQVPPPFPVQLGANEPIQFVGDNQITFENPSLNNDTNEETLSLYSTGDEDKNQIENEDNYKEDLSARKGPYHSTTKLESITNTKNNEDGYFYPRGNPTWSIKNGTLFNPFLNFKAFDFPAVPPNGSVDDFLDQIDEDDPSLYYPPPYSFIYKSNYTNPVPAGPLVPGIILPPPPNAFSRLEMETTTKKSRVNHPSFRQKLTRLQEYKSKTKVVTPESYTQHITTPSTVKYSTSIKSTTSPTTTAKLPTVNFNQNKDVVYAITEAPPSYGKVRYYTPSNRIDPTSTTSKALTEPAPVEEVVSYSPQKEIKYPKDDSPSFNQPIYYEYYDPKQAPSPTPEVYYKEILPPTLPPSPTLPLQHTTSPLPQSPINPVTTTVPSPVFKQYSTRKHKPSKITTIKPVLRKPHKYYSSQGKTYLTPRPYNFDDYINIKPHPEIRPNGIAHYDTPVDTLKPIYKSEPAPDFNREINSIRQTLQFFNGNSDYQQSTHKPKPIYEYSFDATRPNPTTQQPQYDTEPFQPMVKYSPPVDDVNGFRAITYPEVNDPNYYNVGNEAADSKDNQNDRIRVQIIYDSTARPENGFYANSPQATHSTFTQSQNPWISIEKQVVQEIGNNGLPITTKRPSRRRPSSRKIEQIPNNNFDGYFYNPPQATTSQAQRTNNRYYEEPFAKHLNEIRKKLGAAQSQPQLQWNVQNTTNFHYITPRPIYNSNIEGFEQFLKEQHYDENTVPLKSNSWNAANDTNLNSQPSKIITSTLENLQNQRWPKDQLQQQQQQPQAQQWNLESDINVNNIAYGRPPINTNSEFIEPLRQSTHHKSHREKYRTASKTIKQSPEPFSQYLREVTPHENLNLQSQNLWTLESQTNDPYLRPIYNRNAEIIEQSSRPSHNYRQPLPQNQLHRINGAESFKQYIRKIAPSKNFNPHPPQLWRIENDTNINKKPHDRIPLNSNSEFIPTQQKRPIYRDNIREFSPSHKLQQQHQQQRQQQQPQLHQQQQSPQQHQKQLCKWPHNCNSNQNGQQKNVGGVKPGHSLHSDININYGQKLPPLNPNSEFINPYQPFLSEHKQQQQQLGQKPIYNRPQPLLDSSTNYYQQEPYYQNNNNNNNNNSNKNNNNNQRTQRPPK